ncbi:hypothetical protein BCR44DRAFT_70706 [Catenaria anguillulae PL171]|uniref:BAR domain-containing protein n=1 Tax=Catenaria anguillulae PL171 TaxID=765915 RepID=A0A1Y2HYZ5_9FUNG|nr:hypothetical protein BCR44DRAFT_70706 [Catenaria anguillulae PL171]
MNRIEHPRSISGADVRSTFVPRPSEANPHDDAAPMQETTPYRHELVCQTLIHATTTPTACSLTHALYTLQYRKGFTKAVNRAGTSLLQTAGAIEKTTDRDFDDEERRFKSLEAKIDRLHRESKGYLDSLRALSLAQSRMAMTIDAFYDDAQPLSPAARQYKTVIDHLEDQVRTTVDTEYRTTVLDPLGRFVEYFPDYNEAIKKRGHKLLDFDAVRAKHRKLVEKPSDDPSRLPRAEEEVNEARRMFEALNVPLKDELPKVLALRTTYLEPTFEALVKLQYAYYSQALHALDGLQGQLVAAGVRADNPEQADRALEGVVEQTLAEMRGLGIVTGALV